MSYSDENFEALHKQTEQGRLDLLRTDLNLIHTLTDSVESELNMNSREHAVQTFARASKAYGDVRRIFEQRDSWGEEPTIEIKEKLAGLRKELDRLQKLLYPGRQSR